MPDENGSHVTWRELRLLIDPIQFTVNEVRADVKTLLASQAGDEAISAWQRWFFGVVFVGMFGAITTLIYMAIVA